MKKLKIFLCNCIAMLVLVPDVSLALNAEYKCTNECTLCINYPKKTVCSDKYKEDSEDYAKARKLAKFVNDGLITPDEKLKPGFDLAHFAQKYFNCELMIKKAAQIHEAAQNMCITKTVKYKKLVNRMPASTPGKVHLKQDKDVEDDLKNQD